jgi:type II secretory pathway component PulK
MENEFIEGGAAIAEFLGLPIVTLYGRIARQSMLPAGFVRIGRKRMALHLPTFIAAIEAESAAKRAAVELEAKAREFFATRSRPVKIAAPKQPKPKSAKLEALAAASRAYEATNSRAS